MVWRKRLQAWSPTRERLETSRWLRWLAPWLGHPKLWNWSRRGVALGVALGVFVGLLIPLAQIPVTAAAAVVLDRNSNGLSEWKVKGEKRTYNDLKQARIAADGVGA